MKSVMIITSTRAEYGLLKPVIRQVKQNKKLKLILVATGTHLRPEFGNTISEIEKDGFLVDYKLDIMGFGTGSLACAKTIAHTINQFSELFAQVKPDLALVLGDRYEIFAVASAAATLGVPLGHISGGDVTIGAKDDFYRHCITKMANLHFPSCQESYQRVLQLGEQPETVFLVGGLGDENIRNTPLLPLPELEKSLEIKNLNHFALITYHPETQKGTSPMQEMQKLLDALDKTDLYLLFTKANADAGGQEINQLVDAYCSKNSHRAKAFFSLGLMRYLSAMKYTAVVVGNSSSGVVETPSFGVPCINIGDRQKGRFIAQNVICTSGQTQDIEKALTLALSKEFKQKAKQAKSPYYNNCTPSVEIVKIIENYLYNANTTVKTFYDL